MSFEEFLRGLDESDSVLIGSDFYPTLIIGWKGRFVYKKDLSCSVANGCDIFVL